MHTSYGGKRGRGSNRFSNSAPSAPLSPDRDIMEGLRPTSLQAMSIPASSSVGKEVVAVTGLENIGSYNWMNASSPTIMVPGKFRNRKCSPPEWQNKPTPYQVPADTGMFFVDQNGFRMPSAVLLPIIMAVDKTREASDSIGGFDWSSEKIDFVTDRNGLRKLLRWINDAGTNPAPKDFRIDTQLAGNTVLLNRWEAQTRAKYSGYTYGFNFEKASTDPALGCEESTGHHRIVKYDLNGLKMVVRFEVDACIPTSAAKASTTRKVQSIDDLANDLAGISLARRSSADPTPTSSHGLTVINGGAVVSHSSILELTTRTQKRAAEFDWNDAYPQLFFSQTPHHFLAVHDRGRFTEVNKRGLASPDLKAVERTLQPSLRKLCVALRQIKDLVVKHGQRGRLTLVCRQGKLEVFERTSGASCLPDEVMARFED
ncbi:hypothetical protein MSAN_01323400 [Mycena sanguinolenta]|uniref:Geranylgeranyl pyrophosphate synthetase n=1 Tax=Mycena sanguinolenta TaxID=230812 RepID=A0A8H7D0R3_9AGAR|nr:hypothetical protein MSAN_01323400 [Mycena sanguinolenta]